MNRNNAISIVGNIFNYASKKIALQFQKYLHKCLRLNCEEKELRKLSSLLSKSKVSMNILRLKDNS